MVLAHVAITLMSLTDGNPAPAWAKFMYLSLIASIFYEGKG